MVWQIAAAAGLSGLGSFFGAREQADAASDAARASQEAAQQQINLQRDIYNDQRQLFMPYYQAGLQGMYGGSGVMNLLGMNPVQVGGSAPTQSANNNTPPANAFDQYASGQYGINTPAQQQTNQWQAYLDANPDVAAWYNNNNIANSPHLLRGGGRGADLDGDGRISRTEAAQYHYNTHGRAEGRALPTAQPANAFNPGQTQTPTTTPNVVGTGDGAYGVGGDQSLQPIQAEPAASGEPVGSMTQTLRQTPGYQFLLDESRRGLENSFASRGKLMSGAAIDALNTRNLGLADQTYQQSVNNAFNVANLGMGSAAQIGGVGQSYATGASNALQRGADANARAEYGRANAFNAGLQGIGNAAMWGAGYFGGGQ